MKRLFAMLLSVLFIFSATPVVAYAYNGNVEVHYTKSGECYHRANCSYLRSDYVCTLEYAVNTLGLRPCSRCHPPILGEDSASDTQSYHSSGSSSSGSGRSSSGSSNGGTTYSGNSSSEASTKKNGIGGVVLFFGGIIAIFGTMGAIGSAVDKRRKKRAEEEARIAWENRKQQLMNEWGHLSKKEIATRCGVPSNVCFDEHGLPHLSGANEWRDPYTVYTTRTGNYYHTNASCLRGHYAIKTNVTHLRRGLLPCRRCHPVIPAYTEWYTKYKTLMAELHRYQIEVPDTIDAPND